MSTRPRLGAALALVLAPAALGLLAASPAAAAGLGKRPDGESRETFVSGLAFGATWLNDPEIQDVYGEKGRFLSRLTFGVVPWSRYVHVELTYGFGFQQFKESGRFVAGAGESADEVELTLFPMTLDLIVGLDLAEEQPVVPFGGVGGAMTFWRERDVQSDTRWVGYRFGGSAIFGGAIRLDLIERARSRELDAKTGINDCFLTVEGRYSRIQTESRDGAWRKGVLGFGGWSFLAGVKLVY
jgi:hypothetical protein